MLTTDGKQDDEKTNAEKRAAYESHWKDVLRDPEASLRQLAEQEKIIKELAAKKDWHKLLEMQKKVHEQLEMVQFALDKTRSELAKSASGGAARGGDGSDQTED